MTLMLLREGKLNVVFERNDLSAYGLSFEKLNYGNPVTRKIFKEALEAAKLQVGFRADTGRLFVEAFPCSGGGCIVSFTKLGRDQKPCLAGCNSIYTVTGTNSLLAAISLLNSSGADYDLYLCENSYHFVLDDAFPSMQEFGIKALKPEVLLNVLKEAGQQIKL